jgi:hypothetical protein
MFQKLGAPPTWGWKHPLSKTCFQSTRWWPKPKIPVIPKIHIVLILVECICIPSTFLLCSHVFSQNKMDSVQLWNAGIYWVECSRFSTVLSNTTVTTFRVNICWGGGAPLHKCSSRQWVRNESVTGQKKEVVMVQQEVTIWLWQEVRKQFF